MSEPEPLVPDYQFNNPKNYVGYVIAVETTDSPSKADNIYEEYVVKMADEGRKGAKRMGLIDCTEDRCEITRRGELVIEAIDKAYETRQEALEFFKSIKGSPRRFIDTHEIWEDVCPQIIQGDPTVRRLIDLLQEVQKDSGQPHEEERKHSLSHIVYKLYQKDPDLTLELFFRDDDEIRDQIVREKDESLDPKLLEEKGIYLSYTVHQLKTLLYHSGILTESGKDTSSLNAVKDIWKLEEQFRKEDADSKKSSQQYLDSV